MEIIKTQLQINLSKTDLQAIVLEALASTNNAAIKRSIQPFLQSKFPQFPDFPVISLGDTDEKGSTIVTLKQAIPQRTVVAEFEANEDIVLEEKEETEG